MRLIGAHVSGDPVMDGADLVNATGPAPKAIRLRVEGNAFVCDRFSATGRNNREVALRGAHITGQAAQRRRLVLSSERTRVDGALVDNARTDNPPTQVPYAIIDDTRRVVGYFRLAWLR